MKRGTLLLALALASLSACEDRRVSVAPDPASARSCAPCASCAPQGSIVTSIDFHLTPPPPEKPFPPGAAPMPMEAITQVTIQSSGEVRVNGTLAPHDDDLAKLMRAAITAGTTRVMVVADTAVPYGKVVHVIDVAKSAGASTISLGVEILPTPSP